MVDHIALAGNHHDHNTDGIGNYYYLNNWTYCMATVISSGMSTASASKVAVTIALIITSMWIVVLTAFTLVVIGVLILGLVCILISLASTMWVLTSKRLTGRLAFVWSPIPRLTSIIFSVIL